MNAGLMADLPSLAEHSGAEGVGLFRTELQFLDAQQDAPAGRTGRDIYSRAFSTRQRRQAGAVPHVGHRVRQGAALHEAATTSRTRRSAGGRSGWGSTSPASCGCRLQALIRAANGRPLTVMFPMVAQFDEFKRRARHRCYRRDWNARRRLGHSPAGEGRGRHHAGDPEPRVLAPGLLRAVRISFPSAATISSSSSSPPTARTSGCGGATTR